MITEVILPQLGDTMNEGTITRWYKREGERVEKGEPLFEVLTDKANMEIEATTSGYLRAIKHAENETVPTGSVIAYLTTTAEEPLEPSPANEPMPLTQARMERKPESAPPHAGEGIGDAVTEAAVDSEVTTMARPDQPSGWATRHKPFISPRARRLAAEKGVDLSQVTASSPSGRMVEADVQRFLLARARAITAVPVSSSTPPAAEERGEGMPAEERVIPLSGVRRIIAERMASSAREVARVTLTTEADATRLVELREEINARVDTKFSYTEFFVLLAAKGLVKFPYMNATLREDGIHQYAAVHVGVAVDTERGLLVPVIRDAHRMALGEIALRLRELGEQARAAKISPDNLRGGTFTITNLGQYEIDAFTPLVNLPETAILGVGRIVEKPAAYQGEIALRHMVALSLAFDHRVVDGAPAARFMQEIKRLVETPGLLLV